MKLLSSSMIVCLFCVSSALGQGAPVNAKLKDAGAAAAMEGMPRAVTQLRPGSRLLDVRAKIKLLTDSGVTDTTLDTPFQLNGRTPYLNEKTYLGATQVVAFVPMHDQPEIQVDGYFPPRAHPSFGLTFEARTDRSYIIDCIAMGRGEYRTQLTVGSEPALRNEHVRIQDSHLTAVVRKGTPGGAPRLASFGVQPLGAAGLTVGTCEVTPVR